MNYTTWVCMSDRPTAFFSSGLTFARPTDSHVSSDLSLFTAPQRLISVLVMWWDM